MSNYLGHRKGAQTVMQISKQNIVQASVSSGL